MDDDGVITITEQISRSRHKTTRIRPSELSHFEYRAPSFFRSGVIQIFLQDGSKTAKLEVAKENSAMFEELTRELGKLVSHGNKTVTRKTTEWRENPEVAGFAQQRTSPSGISANFLENQYVAVDIEWTDSADANSVCEIGLAKFTDGELIDTYRSYVRPIKSFTMGWRESAVHGISKELIVKAPTLAMQWATIEKFIGESPLVLHNATQDIRRLLATLRDSSATKADFTYIDTMMISRKLPWIKSGNTLSEIADHLGLNRKWAEYDGRVSTTSTPHGALEDAVLTGQILGAILNSMSYTKIDSLLNLIEMHPGEVRNTEIASSPSAPGKLKWESLSDLPSESDLPSRFGSRVSNSRSSSGHSVDNRIRDEFLTQDQVAWSNHVLVPGESVYFSGFSGDLAANLENKTQKMGIQVATSFSAKTTLLVIEDSFVDDSAKLRRALSFKKPVPATNFTNFLANNPAFR